MSYDPPGAVSGVPVYTNGVNAMAANLDLGSNKIVNVTDPTNPQDAATKAYADSITGGSGLTQGQVLSRASLRA